MSANDDDLDSALLVQEVGSVLRHGLRNHLGAIRNANFFLERRLRSLAGEAVESDPRIAKMFSLIDAEIRAAEAILAPEPHVEAVLDRERGSCDPSEVVRAIVDASEEFRSRVGTTLENDLVVATTARLLASALTPIVEAALAASGDTGRVEIVVARGDDGVVTISVTDDGVRAPPEETPPEGTIRDFGFSRARRAAIVWGGRLESEARDPRGWRASLVVPSVRHDALPQDQDAV